MERVFVCQAVGGLIAGAVDFDAGVDASLTCWTSGAIWDGQDTAMFIFTSGTTSCPNGCGDHQCEHARAGPLRRLAVRSA